MMRIETVFKIYHRLQKTSVDFCERVIIERDQRCNIWDNPTAVTVKFIPFKKRKLRDKEKEYLNYFAEYYRLKYDLNEEGEMVWGLK